LCRFIPRRLQSKQPKTTKQLAALATISRTLPAAVGDDSTAKLQQPLGLLLTPSSLSSPIQPDGLPAGGILGAANRPVLPLAMLPISKNRRQPDQSLHHSEGGFNVHKINVISLYLSTSKRKILFKFEVFTASTMKNPSSGI
jgi:hypothetical protein